MVRPSLNKKIVFLIIIPFLAFMVFSLLFIYDGYKELRLAGQTQSLIQLVESTSKLITQLQRERGKSSIFLKGALSQEQIEAQRKETDQKVEPFRQTVMTVKIENEKKEAALRPLALLTELRKAVDQKVAFEESFSRYSDIVKQLMAVENGFLKEETSKGIGRRLITVAILEEAKESAARLRGFASGLIAGNQPLSDKELLTVTTLKAGIDVNLHSPTLMLGSDLKEKLKGFKESPEWQEGQKFFQILLKNADKGQFGIDPAQFFLILSKQIDDIDQLVSLSGRNIDQLVQQVRSKAGQSILFISLLVLSVSAVIAVFCFISLRSITRPISKVVHGLTREAEKLAMTSDQVAVASQSLADGASEQASGLEETSSSMEEMASMTKQNADSASQANSLMTETNRVVEEGNRAMAELNASMSEIATSSQETGKIIKTIDEIAFQTNLLALNAAVEAARAGEAGAGFAVVADEVRNLAMRAAQAARNTSSMIEDTVKTIHKGSAIVSRTNQAFSEMASGSKKVAELVRDIAAASDEQAQGIDQVSKAISEMDRVVQQNAAGAEESASAAEEMNDQAKQMRTFVDQLNLIMRGTANGQGLEKGLGKKAVLKAPERARALGPSQPVRADKKIKPREISPEEVIPFGEGGFKEF
jgi:methyl-accepting chemotaxis protein